MSDFQVIREALFDLLTVDTPEGKSALAALARVEARTQELEDPDWPTFISMAGAFLEHYPADIFDGSSGDPGPTFIVALRSALAALSLAASGENE